MTTTRALCLSLEFDFEGERVTGWLADEEGNDWAFSCWLDLLTLIERVLAASRMPAGRDEQAEEVTTTGAPARREMKGAVGT
jgi:hypothetical protein